MKNLRQIFDDRISIAAGIVFLLIIALVIFNVYSKLPEENPLFGVILFSAVPILFVVGGVIFVLAIIVGSPPRSKLIFLMSAGAAGIVFLVIGGYQLVQFTDSTGFCGSLCHNVMYPEYTVYQASPHSRVICVDCHVGPGASYLVKSKLAGVPLIFATLTGRYDRPIPAPVHSLRPARETCEQCHRPDEFSGDLVTTNTTFAEDEANTATVDTRVMRVGGGGDPAQGIHWHVAAQVWYVALDSARNDIAWVGVDNGNGQLTEYVDPAQASQITPEVIAKDKRLMDCIDCHNRATHIFESPEQLIDTAMAQGKIDKTLPYIKKEGSQALDPQNASLDQANAKVEAIKDFYRTNYPDVYQTKGAAIDQAITQLKEVAKLTTFPDMHVSWTTYPSNLGHTDAPGCFRCHGKLVATTGAQAGQTIDASCTLCHYTLPQPPSQQ